MQMGITKQQFHSPETEATVDQISDASSEFPWEFKQHQKYNWIFHFQLKCWKVKKKKEKKEKFMKTRI